MRKHALAVAAAIVACATASAQSERDWSKIQIKATKVAGQVYVIEDVTKEFSGGNIGVSVGPDGVVLVDDKFAPLAPKIEAALKSIAPGKVRFVINTHFHGDHTDGNAAFGKSSTVIAHENTRTRLLADKKDPVPPSALPIISFNDRLVIHLNGEDIRAIHLPSGHTDTDVVVYFSKSNVVHMGDDYFAGLFPFIDLEGGGRVKGLIANIEKVFAIVPVDAMVIPGHGPVTTMKELRAYLDMQKETTAIVEAGVKAGKTADQLKKEKVLAKYDAWSWRFINTDAFIDQLHKDLSAAR